jgi:hypothetical protein
MHWLFRLSGIAMVANGTWMLGSALHWFFGIPAGMPDTGHPNGHLIRDVGLAYLVFGVALIWCSYALAQRRAMFLAVSAFMIGHALGHVIEIATGRLPPSHWLLDLPLVLAPGALFAVFLLPAAWRWLIAVPSSADPTA